MPIFKGDSSIEVITVLANCGANIGQARSALIIYIENKQQKGRSTQHILQKLDTLERKFVKDKMLHTAFRDARAETCLPRSPILPLPLFLQDTTHHPEVTGSISPGPSFTSCPSVSSMSPSANERSSPTAMKDIIAFHERDILEEDRNNCMPLRPNRRSAVSNEENGLPLGTTAWSHTIEREQGIYFPRSTAKHDSTNGIREERHLTNSPPGREIHVRILDPSSESDIQITSSADVGARYSTSSLSSRSQSSPSSAEFSPKLNRRKTVITPSHHPPPTTALPLIPHVAPMPAPAI